METTAPSNGSMPFLKRGLPPIAIDSNNNLGNVDVYGELDNYQAPEPGLKEIIIPVAVGVVLLAVVVAAAFLWRFRNSHQAKVNGVIQTNLENNNKSLRDLEDGVQACEESVPLKNRKISTSSSTSTVSPSAIPIDASNCITVNMRIATEVQSAEVLKSNRSDVCCEIHTEGNHSQPVNSHLKLDDNFEAPEEKRTENAQHDSKNSEIGDLDESQDDIFPKRPKTLEVMLVSDRNEESHTKDFFCAVQEWTPDADVIYEDTGSPENSCDLRKEQQDRLCPLMGKGRFKMKPKGLLERRGSNVALTISLKNEEKSASSPPPSSRSPKPLVYLRTASAKLDPVQLHIKASDTARLQQEFWEVPMNHPSEKHFSIPGYGTKNRYRSILPNPHSRVMLPAAPGGDPLFAYINANYIRGFSSLSEAANRKQSEDGKENDRRRMSMKRKASFIATQGPMANTIVDFWKMVWRENSPAIVMITKLKERKEKCAEYMPTACSECRAYEQFDVKVKNVRNADHYTVRTIELRNADEPGEIRTVTHYWYAEWLDHETPDKLRSLLTLVQEVDLRSPDVQNTEQGPVIVHCSAGIGRTGCFIAINIGCRQLRFEGKVDPLRIICQLRMDRGGMIQTWEQYQYVHVALSRYARVLAGENVNTPLTGSSIVTPDSRGSSRLTTPSSGSAEFKSPYASAKLFSPKAFAKSELETVDEKAERRSGSGGATASPAKQPGGSHVVKSRFSFSCADSLPGDSTANGRSESAGQKLPLRLRAKISPILSPVRDENWLANGHCTVEGPDTVKSEDTKPSPRSSSSNGVGCCAPGDKSDEADLNSKALKSSIFMFPTPEK